MVNLAVPLFFAGLAIGTLASMFGIGGGVLNVPIIYFLLTHLGHVPDDPAFKSALATSMFIMFFTQLSGGLGHYQKKNYIPGAVAWLAPGCILGGVAGASAAMWLSGAVLKQVFGGLLLFMAWRMLRSGKAADRARDGDTRAGGPALLLFLGFITGLFGALLGVGGGVIIVPILCVVLGHSFHRSVGTSSIIIIFTAAASFARYMTGAPHVSLPWSVGYVNWMAAAALAPGSVIGARLGVRFMLRINPAPLRAAFALLVAAIALKLLGAYQALGALFR